MDVKWHWKQGDIHGGTTVLWIILWTLWIQSSECSVTCLGTQPQGEDQSPLNYMWLHLNLTLSFWTTIQRRYTYFSWLVQEKSTLKPDTLKKATSMLISRQILLSTHVLWTVLKCLQRDSLQKETTPHWTHSIISWSQTLRKHNLNQTSLPFLSLPHTTSSSVGTSQPSWRPPTSCLPWWWGPGGLVRVLYCNNVVQQGLQHVLGQCTLVF